MKITRFRILQIAAVLVVDAITLIVLELFLSGLQVDSFLSAHRGGDRLRHLPGSLLVYIYPVPNLAAGNPLSHSDLCLERICDICGGQSYCLASASITGALVYGSRFG